MPEQPSTQLPDQAHTQSPDQASGFPSTHVRVPVDVQRRDPGQATTEYALILLGAALVGLLVVAWATSGGAAGRIGQLLDAVVDSVISRL